MTTSAPEAATVPGTGFIGRENSNPFAAIGRHPPVRPRGKTDAADLGAVRHAAPLELLAEETPDELPQEPPPGCTVGKVGKNRVSVFPF